MLWLQKTFDLKTIIYLKVLNKNKTNRGEHRKRKKSHAKALACAPKSRRAWVVGCGVRLEYSPTGRQTKRRKSVRVGPFPEFPDAFGAASMAST